MYALEEQIESLDICIKTITLHYEENVRQQAYVDEFKDIQTTVCVSASNTPAPAISPSSTQTPTARPTPTQTPTPSSSITPTPTKTYIPPSKSNTPSITPSPTSSPMCTEWYCENREDSLTGDYPPRCVYTYEAQAGARRLQDWYCEYWQYRVPWEYNVCYDTCPYGMYSYSPKMECMYSCPEGYYGDSSYSCIAKDGGSGGGSGSCSSGQFYHDNMCVDWCPMGFFSDYKNMRCVMQCPSGTFGDTNYWKCLDYCMDPYYGDHASHTCVTECPEFTKPNYDTRTCESTLVYTCLDPEHRLDGTTCYRYSGAQKRLCCGNNICEPNKGEDIKSCPSDCVGTDYATIKWFSKWDTGLSAPQGYGVMVDWSDVYNKFDYCMSSCGIDMGICSSNWEIDARSICDAMYSNIDRQYCSDYVMTIYYNNLQNENIRTAYNNAQSQSGCNGGGGATCGDTFCDYSNNEDCKSCPQDCGHCMSRRLR
jgi:hypothetical protein